MNEEQRSYVLNRHWDRCTIWNGNFEWEYNWFPKYSEWNLWFTIYKIIWHEPIITDLLRLLYIKWRKHRKYYIDDCWDLCEDNNMLVHFDISKPKIKDQDPQTIINIYNLIKEIWII